MIFAKINNLNFSFYKILFKDNKSFFLKGIILIVLLFLFFFTSFAELFKSWFSNNSYYSQGLFVFIVFFWLIKKRYNIQAALLTNSYALGLTIIIFSVLLKFSGSITQTSTFHYISIYLLIIGNIFFFLGKKFVFKNIALFIYLLLAISLPSFILTSFTFKLKLFASFLSGNILSLLYPTTMQYGNLLQINNYYIEITPACSGLENIFGMFSVVFMLALVQSNKRIAIIDCIIALPAAIASNILRIITVSILTVNGYGNLALDTFHETIGIVSFIIVFIMIFLFNEFPPKKNINAPRVSFLTIFKNSSSITAYLIIMSISVIIMFGTIIYHFTYKSGLTQVQFVKDTIPKEIGKWTSRDEKLENYYYSMLETNDLLMRDFIRKDNIGKETIVYLYMAHASNNNSVFLHRPEICLTGEGYNQIEDTEIIISKDIKVHRMLLSRNGNGLLVYYWYRFNAENISSYFAFKLKYLNPAHTRKNGTFIRLSKIVDLNNIKEGENVLQEFIGEALPHFIEKL